MEGPASPTVVCKVQNGSQAPPFIRPVHAHRMGWDGVGLPRQFGTRERRKPEWRKPEFGENLNWREPEFHGYPGTVPWYSICYPGTVHMSASGGLGGKLATWYVLISARTCRGAARSSTAGARSDRLNAYEALADLERDVVLLAVEEVRSACRRPLFSSLSCALRCMSSVPANHSPHARVFVLSACVYILK